MVVSEIHLYELLKAKLGEKEAEAFVEVLEKRVENKFDEAKNTLATKQDVSYIREDMAKLEGGLEAKIAQSESRLTVRMFLFWLGQVAVIAGLLTYFFNK